MKLAALACIALAGCYRDTPAPPATQRPAPPAASGPQRTNELFPTVEVRAVHKCVPTAPPTVIVLLQSQAPSVSWFQIDLDHGERDTTPRTFTIGKDAHVTGCRLRCGEQPTGSVTLDELEPGKRARGRYRFVLDNGDVLVDGFEATWQGTAWETQACPRS